MTSIAHWLLFFFLAFFFLALFLRRFGVGEIGQWVAPEVMVEPGEVVLHNRAHCFGLGDSVWKTFVDDHLHLYAAVFQPLTKLVGVGNRDAAVKLAVVGKC